MKHHIPQIPADLLKNAQGVGSAQLEKANVTYWFGNDPLPENKPGAGLFYLQCSIGFTEKLTICIEPKDPKEWADQLRKENP